MEFVSEESELECFDIDSIADEVEAMNDDTDLKQLIKKMMGHIQKQDQELKSLRRNQTLMNEEMIDNTNALHKLDGRVVELEKYSRKLCLIFSNIEDCGDALTSIIYLLNNLLQININSSRFAACHPLSQNPGAPVIVKFIYHADRDIIWRRKAWLKGVTNSLGKPVIVEECLAPRDRELKNESKQLGLLSFTRKQDVYAFNQNLPNSDAVKVTSSRELNSLTLKEVQPISSYHHQPNDEKIVDTPKQMPKLIRKPTTAIPLNSAKRKRIQVSPITENDASASLANNLLDTLIPALVNALKDNNMAKVKPFDTGANVNDQY